MRIFNNAQKLALLNKADQEGYEIGINGSYTMTGTLNYEALENGLDPKSLDVPLNLDVDKIVDYNPNSITYDVGDGSTLKEHMYEKQLFDYLNDLFELF